MTMMSKRISNFLVIAFFFTVDLYSQEFNMRCDSTFSFVDSSEKKYGPEICYLKGEISKITIYNNDSSRQTLLFYKGRILEANYTNVINEPYIFRFDVKKNNLAMIGK